MARESRIRLVRYLAALIFAAQVYAFGWWWFWVGLGLSLVVYHLGHSIFAHRHFCHGQYNFSPRVEYVLNHLFLMCNLSSSIEYSAIHVLHHRHSHTDKDPHDWTRLGFIPAFFGHLDFKMDRKMALRYAKKPYAKHFHRNYFRYVYLYMIVAAPIMGMVDLWRSFSVIFTHIGGPANNGNWFTWLILWGDEKHEVHHTYSFADKLSDRDMLYYIARGLEWI